MNRKLVEYNYQIKKDKQKKFVFILLFSILLFIFVNVIISYCIYPVRQKSESMSPDVVESSLVMVTPLVKNYSRGDIVLLSARKPVDMGKFKAIVTKVVQFFTAQQLSTIEDEKLPGTKPQLRRVVGMPGDSIYMRDYVMYIKPQGEKHFLTEFEICPKTYNVTFFTAPAGWDSQLGVKSSFEEIHLGENEYFVLGDNRKSTDDSRLWGIISKEQIEAKALVCYFPFNKFKFF